MYICMYTIVHAVHADHENVFSSFIEGCGLPAGLAEVEIIERARAKRVWEATVPT